MKVFSSNTDPHQFGAIIKHYFLVKRQNSLKLVAVNQSCSGLGPNLDKKAHFGPINNFFSNIQDLRFDLVGWDSFLE